MVPLARSDCSRNSSTARPSGIAALTRRELAQLVEGLKVPVMVFEGRRRLFINRRAHEVEGRLRRDNNTELNLLVLSEIASSERLLAEGGAAASLVVARDGATLAMQVWALGTGKRRRVGVSVRELGTHLDAIGWRFRLTPRELEISQLLLRGYSNRDSAAALGVTVSTVKKHLSRLFDKVGVDSRTQLVCRLG